MSFNLKNAFFLGKSQTRRLVQRSAYDYAPAFNYFVVTVVWLG